MAIILASCEKDSDATPCAREMRSFFDEELECRSGELDYAVHLYKGEYDGQTVYFTDIICPSCNTQPPSQGYTCEKEQIHFDDFAEVENVQMVFDSCSKTFLK